VVLGPPSFDNGNGLRELFEHPDEWKQTRPMIDEILYADQCFSTFNDRELRGWFALMNLWNIRLALDVGAVKEWGTTADASLPVGERYWDRIQRLGGRIYAMDMDEPLINCRMRSHLSDAHAVEETAKFVAGVRKKFPDIVIGDIEGYPSIPLKDQMWWIDALQKRLQEMGQHGIDFYELDCNWMNFQIQHNGSWQEVKKLQNYCRARHLPFSLIYWPGSYGWFQGINLADDNTFYVSVMNQGYDYAALDAANPRGFPNLRGLKGGPDQYVIQSWEHCPAHSVPETADDTLTRLALDFIRKFVLTGH
jgi:hypothetical protein